MHDILPTSKQAKKTLAYSSAFLLVIIALIGAVFILIPDRTIHAAPTTRASSVEFFGGSFSGNGATGQNSDTNQTFASFTLALAETNVSIQKAYVVFESQFEGYVDNTGNYTGYNLAFDACSSPCTPSAFGGLVATDTTVLAYDETESNLVRLIADVSAEGSIAAYAGGNALLEGQIGYNLKRGAAVNSIAWAQAKLILTYTYDDGSSEYTNTVIYPLDSTNGTDSGSLQASQSTCTKNINCPLFDYNVVAPEVAASSQRLSQWFTMGHMSGANGTTDGNVSVNIQGSDVDSSAFIAEGALGGGYTAYWEGWFSGVSGFGENTTSTLEAWSQGSTIKQIMGGEVVDTYRASSSAATRTKTVRFPYGVVTNDIATANVTSTAVVNVNFPETGVAIKSAWLRVIFAGHEDTGAPTLRVSATVGTNATATGMAYSTDAGANVTGETEKVFYIIPNSEYAALALATATTSVPVAVNAAASANTIDGVSAELLITYTYTSDANGYLNTILLSAGQTATNGNDQAETFTNIATSTLPEELGTSTVRAAGIFASYLFSDSDAAQAGLEALLDANLATSSPSCVNAFLTDTDGANGYSEFYSNVTAAMTNTDGQSYSSCYTNDGGGDADNSDGAKMNGVLIYTYQWDAPPPPAFTQRNFRFYENVDNAVPSLALGLENASLTSVAASTSLRIRMNVAIATGPLTTSSQAFALQYADKTGFSTCADISAGNWSRVGMIASSTIWRGYSMGGGAVDGASASTTLLSSSTVAQTYEEENLSASNPVPIPVGGVGEWDWVIKSANATNTTTYCFRMTLDDGTPFTGYQNYPELTIVRPLAQIRYRWRFDDGGE